MGLRSIPLFDRMGRPTPFLMAQWAKKSALEPLQARIIYLEPDRSANRLLRALWASAFPTRQPLPFGPVADADGTGTDAWWDVFE